MGLGHGAAVFALCCGSLRCKPPGPPTSALAHRVAETYTSGLSSWESPPQDAGQRYRGKSGNSPGRTLTDWACDVTGCKQVPQVVGDDSSERAAPRWPGTGDNSAVPSNDFNALFAVLDTDPERYVVDEPNVFPSAIGRSFYGSVLPPGHVHLRWSAYAAVWLSRLPMPIPGHFFIPRAMGTVRAEFDRQGAQDWEAFLSLRATELRPGGRLVVVLPALDDAGSSVFHALMDHANAVLANMVDEGAILADERGRMVLGSYPRRRRDLLAPFVNGGQFHQLVVEYCDTSVVSDVAWADYERHGDKEALATTHARFFRSTFAPSLATALTRARDAGACRAFADRLEDGLKRRLVNLPAPLHHLVGTIALAKQPDTSDHIREVSANQN